MNKYHHVENITIEYGFLSIDVDGVKVQRKLKDISPRLAVAKPSELEKFEVSPSGYGIYWPLIDEDVSIDGLLEVVHSPVGNKKIA